MGSLVSLDKVPTETVTAVNGTQKVVTKRPSRGQHPADHHLNDRSAKMGDSGFPVGVVRRASEVLEQTGLVMDWGEFTVVETTDSDIDALLSLRDDAVRWLLARGIDQWQTGRGPLFLGAG